MNIIKYPARQEWAQIIERPHLDTEQLNQTVAAVLADVKARVTHVVGADEKPHDLYCWWRCLAAKAWWHLRPVRRYMLAIYRRV